MFYDTSVLKMGVWRIGSDSSTFGNNIFSKTEKKDAVISLPHLHETIMSYNKAFLKKIIHTYGSLNFILLNAL